MQQQEEYLQYVLLTQPAFDELRARYLEWQAYGFPEIDRPMTGIIEKINRLPGVVTHYSCAGHVNPPYKSYWEGFCVVTGLTERGLSHVRYLWGGLHKRILERSRELPVLSMLPRFVKLEFQMMPNAGITHHAPSSDWVPMCLVQVQGGHPPAVAQPFLEMFEATLDEYLSAHPDFQPS